MSGRLFRSLALLYPKTWRERYADEVADLSAELLAAGEVTRPRLVLELLGSAFAERVRSLPKTRFAVLLSGGAALVVVAVATFLVTNGFGFVGAPSPRMAPVGWGWVRYRDAQVSFPPSFVTVTSQPGNIGYIADLDSPSFTSGRVCVGPLGTEVCLFPMRQAPSTFASEKPVILNNVSVYLGPNGDYYAPSLGVQITARGPLARRIVDTLTRNPTPGCTRPNSRRVCTTSAVSASGTVEVWPVAKVVNNQPGQVGQNG